MSTFSKKALLAALFCGCLSLLPWSSVTADTRQPASDEVAIHVHGRVDGHHGYRHQRWGHRGWRGSNYYYYNNPGYYYRDYYDPYYYPYYGYPDDGLLFRVNIR